MPVISNLLPPTKELLTQPELIAGQNAIEPSEGMIDGSKILGAKGEISDSSLPKLERDGDDELTRELYYGRHILRLTEKATDLARTVLKAPDEAVHHKEQRTRKGLGLPSLSRAQVISLFASLGLQPVRDKRLTSFYNPNTGTTTGSIPNGGSINPLHLLVMAYRVSIRRGELISRLRT